MRAGALVLDEAVRGWAGPVAAGVFGPALVLDKAVGRPARPMAGAFTPSGALGSPINPAEALRDRPSR